MPKCRILSLDGGGIRGLVSAVMLERLEQKLKQHDPNKLLKDYFDIIAGTSAGSLNACGVAHGIDASQIKDLFLKEGITIFPPFKLVASSIVWRLRPGYSQPIFDGIGLEKVLKQVFGQLNFSELTKPTLVVSYDTYNRQSVVFKNTEQACKTIPVWEICRASAAAPVAFPGHILKNQQFIEFLRKGGGDIPEQGIPLIDGGVVANDPALCAVAERIRWNDESPSNPQWTALGEEKVNLENIVVASFGTGQNLKRIGTTQAREWGILEWASPRKGIPLLDVFSDGSADAVGYIAEQILHSRYFRFQPCLNQDLPAFNANPDNLSVMQELTNEFLARPEIDERLNQLVKILVSETKSSNSQQEKNVASISADIS